MFKRDKTTIILPYTGKVTSGVYSKTSIAMTVTVNNIVVSQNQRQNAPVVAPYNEISYPHDNTTAIVSNTGTLGQSPIVLGYIQSALFTNIDLQPGETIKYSDNWLIKYGNNGITASFIQNNAYNATLPSGEWLGKFITDLINDNNVVLRNYINEQINLFLTTHTHSGVQTGGGTSGTAIQTITNITQNNSLNNDQTAINNQEYLLNNNAQPTP